MVELSELLTHGGIRMEWGVRIFKECFGLESYDSRSVKMIGEPDK